MKDNNNKVNSTFIVLVLPPGQQLRDFMLDEVQQFDGVCHPQHQRLQTWDQLLHAEQLKVLRLLVTGVPEKNTEISAEPTLEKSELDCIL